MIIDHKVRKDVKTHLKKNKFYKDDKLIHVGGASEPFLKTFKNNNILIHKKYSKLHF